MLVTGGGELVKTFRSGDEDFSRVGRVPFADVGGVCFVAVGRWVGFLRYSELSLIFRCSS